MMLCREDLMINQVKESEHDALAGCASNRWREGRSTRIITSTLALGLGVLLSLFGAAPSPAQRASADLTVSSGVRLARQQYPIFQLRRGTREHFVFAFREYGQPCVGANDGVLGRFVACFGGSIGWTVPGKPATKATSWVAGWAIGQVVEASMTHSSSQAQGVTIVGSVPSAYSSVVVKLSDGRSATATTWITPINRLGQRLFAVFIAGPWRVHALGVSVWDQSGHRVTSPSAAVLVGLPGRRFSPGPSGMTTTG